MGADLTANKSRAYFRDSYNDSSLLWQYNLSWWRDITPLLQGGDVDPAIILEMMDRNKDDFALNMAQMKELHNRYVDYSKQVGGSYKHTPYEDVGRTGLVLSYYQKDQEFRKYLQDAIEAGDTISCSL